jgi:hypothetical protein
LGHISVIHLIEKHVGTSYGIHKIYMSWFVHLHETQWFEENYYNDNTYDIENIIQHPSVPLQSNCVMSAHVCIPRQRDILCKQNMTCHCWSSGLHCSSKHWYPPTSPALKIQIVCFPDMLAFCLQFHIQHYNPEDQHPYLNNHENLKSYMQNTSFYATWKCSCAFSCIVLSVLAF